MFALCVFVKLYLTAKFILDFIDQLFYFCAMMAAHVINGISFVLRCKNKILLEFNPSKCRDNSKLRNQVNCVR